MEMLNPLLDMLQQTVAIAMMLLAMAALRWLTTRLRLQADSQVREYLDAALARALHYAVHHVGQELLSGQPKVVLQGSVLNVAADYATRHVPDALAHFGLDGAAVRRLLASRMQDFPGLREGLADGPVSTTATASAA